MGIATDLIDRLEALARERSGLERDWRELADHCLPGAARGMAPGGTRSFGAIHNGLMNAAPSRDGARRRYDSTLLIGAERLTAGMESLVTPQGRKWHGLEIDDRIGGFDGGDAAAVWLDGLRDYLFRARYDARAGFVAANQKALRSTVVFGTGIVLVEEGFAAERGALLPFRYQHVPLSEAFLAVDAQGVPDTLFRLRVMTARQIVQLFPKTASEQVRAAAERAADKEERFEILHAVLPRNERSGRHADMRNAKFASLYIERDSRQVLKQSGFHEFPFVVYTWSENEHSPYGDAPTMLALDEARGLSVMRRSGLRALQQLVDPPLAIANDGVMNRPNLNPRATNYGAIDPNGRLRIQPIVTAQNPQLVQAVIESERETIRDILYNRLFQILVDAPAQTATEVMVRANEKGELLGPAGAKIQAGLARLIERELAILERKGAFREGSRLKPPAELAGRQLAVRFTSPLDEMRRAKDVVGIQRTLELAMPLMQIDPTLAEEFDGAAILRLVQSAVGAPAAMFRSAEDRQAAADARESAQSAETGLEAAGRMAEIAERAAGAAAKAEASPALAGLIGQLAGGQRPAG